LPRRLSKLRCTFTLSQIRWSVPDFNNGLNAFPTKANAYVLSPRALDLKRAIEKKIAKPAPEAKVS
jgi:hypothetical protein